MAVGDWVPVYGHSLDPIVLTSDSYEGYFGATTVEGEGTRIVHKSTWNLEVFSVKIGTYVKFKKLGDFEFVLKYRYIEEKDEETGEIFREYKYYIFRFRCQDGFGIDLTYYYKPKEEDVEYGIYIDGIDLTDWFRDKGYDKDFENKWHWISVTTGLRGTSLIFIFYFTHNSKLKLGEDLGDIYEERVAVIEDPEAYIPTGGVGLALSSHYIVDYTKIYW